LDTLAACNYAAQDITVFGAERPERVPALSVTYDLLPMLGVKPIAGRLFTAAEATAEAPYVVLVNARLAERRFGTVQAAVGKTLVIFRSHQPATIVGVLPSTFRFFDTADMWILIRRGEDDGPDMRMAHNWILVGRLKAGVSMDTVQRQLDLVSARLQQQYPATNKVKGLRIDPLQGTLVSDQTPMVMMLTQVGTCGARRAGGVPGPDRDAVGDGERPAERRRRNGRRPAGAVVATAADRGHRPRRGGDHGHRPGGAGPALCARGVAGDGTAVRRDTRLALLVAAPGRGPGAWCSGD
jgi:hypothetical protein